MGDGDVRLAPLLGLFLGWINPGIVPVGLFFGFLARRGRRRGDDGHRQAGSKTAVPFGPFLAVGTIVAVFVGSLSSTCRGR